MALRFPVPIELTAEELRMADEGMFVTRVIYVENPNDALPVRDQPDEQQWVEAPHGADPLVVADEMGRPIAILRIGGRVPIEYGHGVRRLSTAGPALQRKLNRRHERRRK